MRRDWIAGLVLLGIAIGYYIVADGIPRSQLSDAVGAASFPKLLAGLLAVLSVLLIATGLFAKRRAVSEEERKKLVAKDVQAFLRAGGTLLLGVGYLLVVNWAGYAIAAMLLLAGMLVYNGMKLDRRNVLVSVVGGGFFWLLFRVVFDIPMPAGIWPEVFGI